MTTCSLIGPNMSHPDVESTILQVSDIDVPGFVHARSWFDSAGPLAALAPTSLTIRLLAFRSCKTFSVAMLALSDEPFERSEKGEESKWAVEDLNL